MQPSWIKRELQTLLCFIFSFAFIRNNNTEIAKIFEKYVLIDLHFLEWTKYDLTIFEKHTLAQELLHRTSKNLIICFILTEIGAD